MKTKVELKDNINNVVEIRAKIHKDLEADKKINKKNLKKLKNKRKIKSIKNKDKSQDKDKEEYKDNIKHHKREEIVLHQKIVNIKDKKAIKNTIKDLEAEAEDFK